MKISTVKTHASGIALGGIGAGSVELFPDGEFHSWLIANQPRITRVCFEDKVDDGEDSTGSLSFWVREVKENGKAVVRKLGMKTDADDFTYRMFSWNKPVEKIEFDGKFPLAELDYIDRNLSCKLKLKAVSPFVPHNSDISSTPGFYMDFTVENPTDSVLDISLLGALVPDVANKEEGNKNSLHKVGEGVGVLIEPLNPSDAPYCGNMCFSVNGEGEKSYITAEHYRFMKEFIADSDIGVTQESVVFGFRETGRLPNTEIGAKPEPLPENLASLTDSEIDALIEKYVKYPYIASILSRIKYCDPSYPATREDKIKFLDCCINENDRRGEDFGACALCSEIKLEPYEKKNIRFILTWFFPNHKAYDGTVIGNYYENLYRGALDANKTLEDGFNSIYKSAVEFSELLYSTDLPLIYPDAWSSNLSQMVKSSVYIKNGKFGLWEGLGYCGLHTTDITYHASFSLINIFPDLQKKQMKMGAEYQREDGRVHHSFKPDMRSSDSGFDRVDMNMQFVLMVLRDYLFTGDREYLVSMWDNVRRAMDSTQLLDSDNDGLPDYDTKRNTYDAWNFSGIPVYIAVLWLAALKAAVVIADRVGDTSCTDKWKDLLSRGKNALEEKLWNGEYYNLWRNNDETDESLMTDQLDGEWFLRMTGLEGNIPDSRVAQVLDFIFRHNFDEEQGLLNATTPENRKTSVSTYKNCQTIAVWTGIGYAFSALSLATGQEKIAENVLQSINDTQLRFGHFWDHWECGHHYTRPMSSWTLLHAAAGLKVDYENKKLTFSPKSESITLPVILPDILMKATIKEGKIDLTCIKGDISGWDIRVL